MKELVQAVGNNIKRIRSDRGLSLDGLSEITGVSKSMLHQIERGESNPTVVTLWKIASSLNIPFGSLVDQPETIVSLVRRNTTSFLSDDPEKHKLFPYFPFNPSKKFEILTLVLNPGGEKHSEAHQKGVEEYILISKGTVEATIDNSTYTLSEGDAIHFVADCRHSFHNKTDTTAELIVLDYYTNKSPI